MSTIIDSLIVTLGLDNKNFKQGQAQVKKDLQQTGDEAEKTGKKLNSAGKDGAKGFAETSNELSKFLAKLGGLYLLKKFVVDTVQTNAELYRFSRNLGESTNKISAWSNAIEITGGDAKAFQGTLSMLSRSQTELQMTGQSGLLPYFSRFNVAMMDMHGNARKGTDILLDFADRMQGMDRTTAFNILQSMGLDAGTANAMLEGRKSLEALIAKQKEHGALTDQQALNSEKTRRSMTEAEITTRAMKNEMVDGLNPALKNALDLFNQLDIATNGWSTAILGAITSIGLLKGALGAAAAVGGAGAAAGAGGAGAAAGAAASGGLLARLGGFLKGGIGLAALFHSGDLNANEDAELAARRARSNIFQTPEQMAMVYFKSKGWTEAQAAGIVANLKAESGLKSTAEGDNGKAYGVAQWHPDRQAAFKTWAGRDIRSSTLEEQLEFVHYELTAGNEKKAGAALRGATTAAEAGDVMSRGFERPAAVEAEAVKRSKLATLLSGMPGVSNMAANASNGPRQASGGNTQVTTSIGEIKVYTQATDAQGIARDIGPAINAQFPAQANVGLF